MPVPPHASTREPYCCHCIQFPQRDAVAAAAVAAAVAGAAAPDAASAAARAAAVAAVAAAPAATAAAAAAAAAADTGDGYLLCRSCCLPGTNGSSTNRRGPRKNALACVPARPVSGRWHDLALPLLGAALAGADLRATRRMDWGRARRATRGMPRPFVGMDAGRRHEAAAERSFRGEAVTGRGPTRRNQSPAACSRREKLTGQARTGVEPALVVGRAQLLRAGPGIHHDVGTWEVPRLP